MRRAFTPLRVAGGLVVLLLLTILILSRLASGDYMLLPDTAHPLAPFVRVQGARPGGHGQLYYVDVLEDRASELDSLFHWLHPRATYLPVAAIVPPGSTPANIFTAEQQQMRTSQKIAAAVALRHLGYHVVAKPGGILVDFVYPNTDAEGKIQPEDVILAVDGIATPTLAELHSRLGRVKPGSEVTLRLRRGLHVRTLHVKTKALQGRAVVGIEVQQSVQIKLPIRVSINLGQVGGPSAGLAFALEVMEKLGHDVTRGNSVAATGEIELNGAIAPIGGVKQKTFGVREAGVSVFLVPAGANARTARKYAGSVRIIPVRTFAQALRALATLPRSR